MGGNAIKNTKIDRMNNSEFISIKNELVKSLKGYDFKKLKYYFVKSYSDKDSHGDIDVLLFYNEYPFRILENIQNRFKPSEIYKNDNTFSFDFKSIIGLNVQVDFIYLW